MDMRTNQRTNRIKARLPLLPLLLCLLLPAGCGLARETAPDTGSGVPETTAEERVETLAEDEEMGPKSVEPTPEGDASMPEDFQLRWEAWYDAGRKNVLDTFEGYVQKDLVLDGTARADLAVTPELRQRLYDKAVECALPEITRRMTSDVLATTDERIGIEPCGEYRITLQMNGNTYTVTGDDTAAYYAAADPDAANFWAFRRFLAELLASLEEYQSLPAANGAYE